MEDEVDGLAILGDDLDAILDVLEEDEFLQEEFLAAVNNAQTREIVCDCGKKYKTKGGYDRHRATKHAENEGEMATLTTSTLNEIVNIAMEKIKERKVFNASIRNEMTVFRFELEEGSQEFSVLKTAYESLLKKGDAEKFYSNFYGDIAANATRYFKGLTRNAATLLATKVADSMILFWKQKKQTTTKSIAAELNDKQRAGLQYIGGYVLQNLFKKHCRVNSDESQQAMAILKAGKVESGASQKLVSSLNRGGLWSVTLPAEKIFLKTENYFRQSTVNEAFHKIDINSITLKSSKDSDVLANYDLIVSEAECKPDIHVRKDVLHDILSLYVRVRSFSYSKDIVQLYRIKAKQNKSRSLRKEISRSCQENEQQRQV